MFKISKLNATGRISIVAPGSPPRNVTVKAVGCHVINLTWSAPPDEDWNGRPLKYHVHFKVCIYFKSLVIVSYACKLCGDKITHQTYIICDKDLI